MINQVELIRLETGDDGTFGVLRVDGKVHCVTLEPPDEDNRQNVSCVPEGEYVCRRIHSPRYGNTFEVADVPGRTHILFHPGNVVGDTRGCVLVGRQFGLLRGDRAVLNSGKTFDGFMALSEGIDEFRLTIENVCKEGQWKVSA